MKPLTLPRSRIYVVWCLNLELHCVLKITILNMLLEDQVHKTDKPEGIHITAKGLQNELVGSRQGSGGKQNWVQALAQPIS